MNIRIASMALVLFLISGQVGCSSAVESGAAAPKKPAPATNEQARAQIDLARALLLQGEYTKALPELLKARELDPKSADVENLLGLTYSRGLKEYPLAVESFQKALALDGTRTDVHNNLGLVYLDQRDYERALAEFNLCLKDLVYQKKQLPLSNIGFTYLEMGRYDEALAALTRAVEVAPDYDYSYQLIGRVYLAQNKYSEAVDYLNNAARINPNDPDTLMYLGDAYVRQKKPQDAAEAYSRAAALVPNTPRALEAQKRARQAMGF